MTNNSNEWQLIPDAWVENSIKLYVFDPAIKSAYKAGVWSRIVGMAKQVRFGAYQDYAIYFFNVSAILDQINSNITKGSGQEVFIDALNGVKAIKVDIDNFNMNHTINDSIKEQYKVLAKAALSALNTTMFSLRDIVNPSNAGGEGIGLGGGKISDKMSPVKDGLNTASENLDKVGSLFKEYYKTRLGKDDYVHTDKNSRTQDQLDEFLSQLKDELIDVTANIRSFNRLPFTFQTQTNYDYHQIPQTSEERIAKKQPRQQGQLFDTYGVDEVRQTTHNNVVAIPKEVKVISEGSRQYAVIGEANTFVKFYNQWYANFYRTFKIYPKPLGSIQGLITPIIDDLNHFSKNELLRSDEKAFEKATDILVYQISKVLKVLGQIKLT